MAGFKRVLIFLLVGGNLGVIVASLIAPKMIAWYNTPGFAAPAGLDLAPFTQHVMRSLVRAQLIGAAVGAAILLVLLALWSRRGRASRAAGRAAAVEAAAPRPPAAGQG